MPGWAEQNACYLDFSGFHVAGRLQYLGTAVSWRGVRLAFKAQDVIILNDRRKIHKEIGHS